MTSQMMTSLSNATDKQLMTIFQYDRDCSKELLEPVILEMMKRHLFKPTILHVTKNMKFHDLDYDDMEQIGHIAIWKALKKYKVGESAFSTYCRYDILGAFSGLLKKTLAERRTADRYAITLETPTTEGITIQDVIPCSTNVEKTVIRKMMIEDKMDGLSTLQRQAVEYFVKGFDVKDMSKILGKSRQNIERAFHRAIEKMGGERINLKIKYEVIA